jgi:hypothetical protein
MYADLIAAEARARIDVMLDEAAAHRLLVAGREGAASRPAALRIRQALSRTLFELAERVAVRT